MLNRRTFLLSAVAAAGCARRGAMQGSLQSAAAYLWKQQDADGGWHSHTYGLLRSGQSLTPFVLDALLGLPEIDKSGGDRAVAFIIKGLNAQGSLGLSDDTPDYPNYATGLGLRALIRAKASGWEPMLRGLRAQQFTEDNGWKREDAGYGAWGMGGEVRHPPEAGHVDLAMTRYVIEGLAAAGVPASDAAMQKALVYLGRCQNPDGGFFFSTVNLDTNKAGNDTSRYRSYGTATADGLISLRAAGAGPNDPRVTKAERWLKDHHTPRGAPGFDEPARKAWGDGLRYYYAAAVSRAMPGLPVLLPPQQQDGSFRNSSNLVKEDDPLIATAFAVRTLWQHKDG